MRSQYSASLQKQLSYICQLYEPIVWTVRIFKFQATYYDNIATGTCLQRLLLVLDLLLLQLFLLCAHLLLELRDLVVEVVDELLVLLLQRRVLLVDVGRHCLYDVAVLADQVRLQVID